MIGDDGREKLSAAKKILIRIGDSSRDLIPDSGKVNCCYSLLGASYDFY